METENQPNNSEETNELVANTLSVILDLFKPSAEITDDSMTTPELCEIVSDHIGIVLTSQVVKSMLDAGYIYKFSLARREMVWCMEMV